MAAKTQKSKNLIVLCKRATVCRWCGHVIGKQHPMVYPSGRRDGRAWHPGCLRGYGTLYDTVGL